MLNAVKICIAVHHTVDWTLVQSTNSFALQAAHQPGSIVGFKKGSVTLHQKKRNFVEDRRKEKADTASQGTICMIFIFYLSHQDVIDEGVKSLSFSQFQSSILQIVPNWCTRQFWPPQ